jgi:hypothetical protein
MGVMAMGWPLTPMEWLLPSTRLTTGRFSQETKKKSLMNDMTTTDDANDSESLNGPIL